jgi:hypothetical protein
MRNKAVPKSYGCAGADTQLVLGEEQAVTRDSNLEESHDH